MNTNGKKRWMKLTLLAGATWLAAGACWAAQAVEVVKDPRPTCREGAMVRLVKVHEFSEDLKNDIVLAKPVSCTVDPAGNAYVYDQQQGCIFVFDNHLRYLRTIGRPGQGPGQFPQKNGMVVRIGFGLNGVLYAHNPESRRISAFSPQGNLLQEFQSPFFRANTPVVDQRGFFYFPSIHDGVIDVYNEKCNLMETLLKRNLLGGFLFSSPVGKILPLTLLPSVDTMVFFVNRDGSLFALIKNSSLLLKTKGNGVVIKKNLWPKQLLWHYKRALQEICKAQDPAYIPMFSFMFPDLDEQNTFYLHTRLLLDTEPPVEALYKYNVQGDLKKVLCANMQENNALIFFGKSKQMFYALNNRGNILTYKEEK